MKKIVNLFFIGYLLCFRAIIIQASNIENTYVVDVSEKLQSSFSSVGDNDVRQARNWNVLYRGYDLSHVIDDEEYEKFNGTKEELNLRILGLKNQRRLNFVIQRDTLLSEVSNALTESLENSSANESVAVEIRDFGDNYKVKLDYTYHAFDLQGSSFQDDQSSSTREVDSKEEIMSLVRTFVAKHKHGSIKLEEPCLKKQRNEPASQLKQLKQLTLQESFARNSIKK